MSCKSCEERRQKLKAMYEQSIESITKVITYLTNKGGKTEQSADQSPCHITRLASIAALLPHN